MIEDEITRLWQTKKVVVIPIAVGALGAKTIKFQKYIESLGIQVLLACLLACLLAMLEKWKNAVDTEKIFGALLTDLSKAFDSLSHDLLITKLNAYGFSLPALKLVHSYLSNRKKRTKINNAYSSWEEILFGVSQGSILGPILFNIFLCDLFLVVKDSDFTSYADDNTIYDIGDSINDVIASLEDSSEKLFQ